MIEVPLYPTPDTRRMALATSISSCIPHQIYIASLYRGTSLIEKRPPPRTTEGP